MEIQQHAKAMEQMQNFNRQEVHALEESHG